MLRHLGLPAPPDDLTEAVTAVSTGRYGIETAGHTDVVMALTGPGDSEHIIAEDDDAGRGLNARIEAKLDEGDYVVRVWHYWPTRTGDYEVGLRSAV